MSKTFQVILGLILSFCFSVAFACPAETKDCTMDKKVWTEKIDAFMPAEFCKADSPFIKCYDVSQTGCYEISVTVTQQCIADYEKIMPNSFNKADSKKWGEIIGSCAGDKLTDIIKLKEGKSASCANEQ
jgi:hypothetical protein